MTIMLTMMINDNDVNAYNDNDGSGDDLVDNDTASTDDDAYDDEDDDDDDDKTAN